MRIETPPARVLRAPTLLLSRRDFLCGVGASAFVSLGALPEANAFTLRAARFRPPPVGSKWAYEYRSGQMEHVERIEDGAWVTWNVVRAIREIEGEELQVRSYNILSGNWMVSFDKLREPLFAADPDDRRYRWPVSTGGFWRSTYTFRDYRKETSFEAVAAWSVVGLELLQTPFGLQRTLRLRSSGTRRDSEIWFAFDMGVRLRETTYEGSEILRDKWLVEFDRAPDGGRTPRKPPWEVAPAADG